MMAHSYWIKVVAKKGRKTETRGKKRGDVQQSPSADMRSKNSFSALADLKSSKDVKSRSCLPVGRGATGKGIVLTIPKDKFQAAFVSALRSRVAFLKRRLSPAEMKRLASSVRRGWTAAKKDLPVKSRKPGLGYMPSSKPSYAAVLKREVVPSSAPSVQKGFVQGKTLVGSLPADVAKAAADSVRRVAKLMKGGSGDPSKAKEAMALQVSAGARVVASSQEVSARSQLAAAKLKLLSDIGREIPDARVLFTLRAFAERWGADVLDSFTKCVRVWSPQRSGTQVYWTVDESVLGAVPRELDTEFIRRSPPTSLQLIDNYLPEGVVVKQRAQREQVARDLLLTGVTNPLTIKEEWSLGTILTQQKS